MVAMRLTGSERSARFDNPRATLADFAANLRFEDIPERSRAMGLHRVHFRGGRRQIPGHRQSPDEPERSSTFARHEKRCPKLANQCADHLQAKRSGVFHMEIGGQSDAVVRHG